MHLLFRALYRLLRARATVAAAAEVLRLASLVRGPHFPQKALDRLSNDAVWSGWPSHERGWVNLDVARFVARVGARLDRLPRRTSRPVRPRQPLRVGLVGQISGLLPTPPQLLAAHPASVELHVFDVDYRGLHATWARELAAGYTALPSDGAVIAASIEAADLDLLLVLVRDRLGARVVSRVRTPVVAFVCTGPDLLHHEGVSFHLYSQPEADYFVRDDRLFCGTTRTWFGGETAYDAFLYFDDRGLLDEPRAPWREREPLIVYHGSLYKAATPSYLGVVFGLLRCDDSLRWRLYGRDDGSALAAIEAAAAAAGVAERVTYEGAFEIERDAHGVISDPTWKQLRGDLARARLAPDPWPVSGSSARVEAYACGVPTPHLGLRLDRASWGRPQPTLTAHPSLATHTGTAYSVEAYAALCRRCLSDEAFAGALVDEQLDVARRVADPRSWWSQVLRLYEQHRSSPAA